MTFIKNFFLISIVTLLSIFFATFVSEDLTCIAAGILAKEGKLSLSLAIFFTGLGIFVGDCILYFLGLAIRKGLVQWSFLTNLRQKIENGKFVGEWKLHYRKSIFLSRFLPGTRLTLYLSSGFFALPFFPFLYTSFIAVSIWTTAFVTLVYLYGNILDQYLNHNHTIFFSFVFGFSFYFIYKLFRIGLNPSERDQFLLNLSKLKTLEFWPAPLFYLPLVPYLFYLAIRYKGIRYITIVNPGILASGIAGESKSEILDLIPSETVASSLLVSKIDTNPLDKIQNWMNSEKLQFPIIAKPDKGERGFLIQKVYSIESCRDLIQTYPIDWLFQEYQEGPFEVGVFYYRFPNQEEGRIFSITDKIFPKITGDGISDLETLIKNHQRFRFQSKAHFEHNKHRLNEVLPLGETTSIGSIGNHIQGCMFQDGDHWRTKEMEKKIISIGDSIPGFYFGRFDIRFSDPNQFRTGRGFKIIELNGATSESTNLYDPNFSISQSYSLLFGQWKILFQIGYENDKRGVPLFPYLDLFKLVKNHRNYRKLYSTPESK
ncbi:DedA family protein [Leptospira harrisiae]|uniref:DedA family protein n=1 Tax=Leptospira harrisiae TaxID=2023189 RepID=UPI001FAFD570|nr:VTT domain-containing protein [Leptospira harrisiae]